MQEIRIFVWITLWISLVDRYDPYLFSCINVRDYSSVEDAVHPMLKELDAAMRGE